MRPEAKTRAGIAAVIYGMINAVIFGIGLILVLTIPTLATYSAAGILAVVIASLFLAAPIAWWLAPRLRARYWRA